ncbi:MAG: hypothetical protein Tsb0019_30840 [Roseibium sp.]
MTSLPKKLAIAALAGGVLTLTGLTAAEAQSGRPNTTTMTCAQVQSMINQRGAVVMSTGRHTFDRYVANRSFCAHGEYLRRDYVPTRDNNRCYVQRCDPARPFWFDN